MRKRISVVVPTKAPRNGHVAVAMVRSGAGAHGKTRKAERRSSKVALRRLAGGFPSGIDTVAVGSRPLRDVSENFSHPHDADRACAFHHNCISVDDAKR